MDIAKNKKFLILGAAILILIGGISYWHRHSVKKAMTNKNKTTQSDSAAGTGKEKTSKSKISAIQQTTTLDSNTTTPGIIKTPSATALQLK